MLSSVVVVEIPLLSSFNLPSWWWRRQKSSEFHVKNILLSKGRAKSHICFTSFNNNNNNDSSSSSSSREESRWIREEQRWLREEQRWIREERRWEAERETLLNEIKRLGIQIQAQGGGLVNNNHNQISSNAPVMLQLLEGEDVVVDKDEDEIEYIKTKNNMTTLRAGSQGDQVQMLQEALLKLGFYCGEEDEEFATFSSGTERAVKTWQSTIGVPETGIMTPQLLQTLFPTSASKEGANGVAANSITQTPEIPKRIVKEIPEPDDVSEHRVFLLGENRWEDSSRLKNQNTQTRPNSKGAVKTKCITCRGEGRLLCLECDGTGEPNIEPQFLEWVGEDTKCPYCEGDGHTICDVCQGTGADAA